MCVVAKIMKSNDLEVTLLAKQLKPMGNQPNGKCKSGICTNGKRIELLSCKCLSGKGLTQF